MSYHGFIGKFMGISPQMGPFFAPIKIINIAPSRAPADRNKCDSTRVAAPARHHDLQSSPSIGGLGLPEKNIEHLKTMHVYIYIISILYI